MVNGHGHGLPPGFRFHPTDEELIRHYLAPKVWNMRASGAVEIAEVDLKRCEPWEVAAMLGEEGSREWYLLSRRDCKYPTGLRTNRATQAGYWKATGKDRHIVDSGVVIGIKKTLVFYEGRAPRGHKTKWVMHEYRLHHHSHSLSYKPDWVLCRLYLKSTTTDTSSTSASTLTTITPAPPQFQPPLSPYDDLDMDVISAFGPLLLTS